MDRASTRLVALAPGDAVSFVPRCAATSSTMLATDVRLERAAPSKIDGVVESVPNRDALDDRERGVAEVDALLAADDGDPLDDRVERGEVVGPQDEDPHVAPFEGDVLDHDVFDQAAAVADAAGEERSKRSRRRNKLPRPP